MMLYVYDNVPFLITEFVLFFLFYVVVFAAYFFPLAFPFLIDVVETTLLLGFHLPIRT